MKRAIIIGINNYHAKFGGIDLEQCVHDANRFADAIPADVGKTVLVNKGATKEAILTHLRHMSQEMGAGDVLYYFQSSHGTYSDLTNGTRATGRVMYDAVLWDYEIFEALMLFDADVAVVTISDMCFAESNTRNFAMPGVRVKTLVSKADAVKPYMLNTRKLACTLVALSACQVDETAKEIQEAGPLMWEPGGVFTTALLKNLHTPLNRLKSAISRKTKAFSQKPEIERVKAKHWQTRPLFWKAQ